MSLKLFLPVCLLVFMIGCSVKPVTDGVHTVLPKFGTRATVWGNDLRALHTTATWLKKNNLEILDWAVLSTKNSNQLFHDTHSLEDEKTILKQAQKYQIDLVVFVERTGELRAPLISVRGVDAKSARVLWSGSARYPNFINHPLSHSVITLTCQALATAWGLREPGTQSSSSEQTKCEL